MTPRQERIRRAVELLGGPYAVPAIVAGSLVFALLSSCSPASAQGTTYKDGPGLVLDFVLSEKGWEVSERERVKSAMAVRANSAAVRGGASWIGQGMRAAGRAAGAAGVALTAYEVYDYFMGEDGESVTLEPQDFDIAGPDVLLHPTWETRTDRGEVVVTVDGWLNDFVTCPGFTGINACIQDAVFKDLHHQMMSGSRIVNDHDFGWQADPGRIRVVSVQITGCPNANAMAQPAAPVNYAMPVDCNYTAEVEVPFYDMMTNELMGTSRVTIGSRVTINPTTTSASGEVSAREPRCVYQPNGFPAGGMIHLCGMGPINQPASNVPVPLDQLDYPVGFPSWLRYTQPNPVILTELFNSWGRNLHQLPGYEDLRWRDITPADLPTMWQGIPLPSLQDLNSPIRNPSTGTYPWAPTQPLTPPGTGPAPVPPPGTGPNPNPNPEPTPNPEPNPDPGGGGGGGDGNDIDLSHPDVPDPDLTHPTIRDIIDPALNMFPDLKDLQLEGAVGQCPTARFDVFGTTQVIDSHCEIIEDNRNNISRMSMLAYTLVALLIVLAA